MSAPLDTTTESRFVLGPNASLTVRGACLFMASVSVATLGAAIWCVAHGFWPVLPFAGLELGAVGWALAVSMRRNRYREVVSFGEERVRIEFGVAGQGIRTQVELPRGWTRVWLERDASRRHAPTRLVLGCSGQRVVIGACLTDEERDALLARFRNVLQLRPIPQGTVGAEAGMTLGEG